MTYVPEEKEFKVEEITYRIQKLLASDHWRLACELGQLTGGIFNGVGIDNDIDIGKIVSGLFANATPDKMSDFMQRVMTKCVVQPSMANENYERHFGQYFHHTFEVFGEILKLNFGKSIEELKKKLTQSEMFMMTLNLLLNPQKEKKEQEKDLSKSNSDSQSTKASNGDSSQTK